ncbi:MAG: translation initiation factor IF-5A [Euryarchaeota archaeon]|nr:translation initiation factor IF-5A [Euryarchaeota archaeon]
MKEQAEMKVIKEGKYIIIDEEPCVVMSTAHSKPGKHGAAKLRVDAVGLFDGQRRSMVAPVDTKIYIPIVERKTGQILSINGDMAQIMNMSDYSNFDLKIPPDLQAKLAPGQEVFYMESMGKIKFDIRSSDK